MERIQFSKQGILNVDLSMFRVPLKKLKRLFMLSHKYHEYALTQVKNELQTLLAQNPAPINKDGEIKVKTPASKVKVLNKIILLMDDLKKKRAKIEGEKNIALDRLIARMEYCMSLDKTTSYSSNEFNDWIVKRFEIILATYMYRCGYNKTADAIVAESKLEKFLDTELFIKANEIAELLKKHDTQMCLKWCLENRSGLEAIKSNLDFNLRLQDYVELVREGKRDEAIYLLRTYLSAWKKIHLSTINSASALLIYPPEMKNNPYGSLYSEKRWDELLAQFRNDYIQVNNFSKESLFISTLQAGIIALKTPACCGDRPEMNSSECPICIENTFGELSKTLPNVHKINSVLIDCVTREIMDEENPPIALPNGFVYSKRHITEIAKMNNDTVICPKTGESYKLTACKKVFIL